MSAAGDETMPGGTPASLLAHHLKQLKLPTVLREHDQMPGSVPRAASTIRAICSA
ncbi:hypothetical protein GCM10007887_38740 [Methylobacterium haplocladii]|uniref:Uncharacterized protein n=1 Tax=Methylobacterium haplocladii TaxID=1176176 RepID=A0A512IVZ1_9HYPH|nr:hypothetical protein MHA02_42750 [Methylobacterium haplocladii]GJD86422.1 hypothetical protein HPGCJGGD_4329 [Methylobacterium haplocladii]GLS61177.1 hypothetical protein GCM10007887_38740 [Methylobacterium haplocladii]